MELIKSRESPNTRTEKFRHMKAPKTFRRDPIRVTQIMKWKSKMPVIDLNGAWESKGGHDINKHNSHP